MRHAEFVALAITQPADARGQALEAHALLRERESSGERISLSGNISSTSLSVRRMSEGSPESATQRKGPRPSQKSGRM